MLTGKGLGLKPRSKEIELNTTQTSAVAKNVAISPRQSYLNFDLILFSRLLELICFINAVLQHDPFKFYPRRSYFS